MWYSLAEANAKGDLQKKSADIRDVAHRMTPEEIAEAQRLAQQCQTKKFKGC
jgi:hypothetical protein